MYSDSKIVSLADGRCLAYAEYGNLKGRPILYCHGFPSSRREALLLHETALAEQARIIAPDRPGYGDSDYLPDRTIPGWAGDVCQLADLLDIQRFAVLGVSGGAPYALACAWRIPERISTCALVCPLGPVYLDPLLGDMNWATQVNLSAARYSPLFSELLFGPMTSGIVRFWPQTVDHLRLIAAPAADRAELGDVETRRVLNQTFQDAMRDGGRGTRQELALYTRDWGIPFADIALPLDLWHGEEDAIVPVSHTRWYAANLRDVRARYLPGEGHYSLPLRHAREILKSLLQGAGAGFDGRRTPT